MTLTIKQIESYLRRLELNERSQATVEKYRRDLLRFLQFLPRNQPLQKKWINKWKQELITRQYSAATVNSMLSPVNGLLKSLKLYDFQVRPLKRQKPAFSDGGKELSREEYFLLVHTAEREGNQQLALILETICATGIRVSELRFITVESVRAGAANLMLKGKCRRILIPQALQNKLHQYIQLQKLTSGPVFCGRSGWAVSRQRVWYGMKKLSQDAGIPSSKVFPYNLRHLFARAFYALEHDIAKLADILGHSSIETTRLYIMTTEQEHLRQLDRLKLTT